MAKPSKASVRAIVEGLLAYKLNRALSCQVLTKSTSNGKSYPTNKYNVHSYPITKIVEFLNNSWFDEEFSKDACVTSSDISAGYRTGPGGIASFCPEALSKGHFYEDSVEYLDSTLIDTGLVTGIQGFERTMTFSDKMQETRYLVHISLNKEAIAEVMDKTIPATNDMFTSTRARKESAFWCRFDIRTLWDLCRNPNNYVQSGSNLYLACPPAVRGKDSDKQNFNLAKSLVSKHLTECLSIVCHQDMTYCMGAEQVVIEVDEEVQDLFRKMNRTWRLQEAEGGNTTVTFANAYPLLNFTPTKPEEMELRIRLFHLERDIFLSTSQKIEEQSGILLGLYKEYGKDFYNEIALKLVEEVSMNPMNYIMNDTFKGMATLCLGG